MLTVNTLSIRPKFIKKIQAKLIKQNKTRNFE